MGKEGETLGLEEYGSEEIYREAEKRIIEEASKEDKTSLVCMNDIKEEETTWLYQPYIPRGKNTLVAAYPGAGKTFMLCYVAACVTTGRQLFDLIPFNAKPENVIYLTSEDGLGDTIKKRLRVCGADMKKVFSVIDEEISLTFDSPKIEEIVKDVKPALLIFDPFQSYIGENVEMNAANKTRAKLNHLKALAEKYNIAIVLICHFNKNQKGDAITRVIGSTDIVGICRSYMAIGNVPGEPGLKYLSHEKSSLDERGDTILFEIDPENGGIKYIGQTNLTMDDYNRKALETARKNAPNLEEAMKFLKAQIPDGERPVKEIKELAKANGISRRTLERASKKLGVISIKNGFGGEWVWKLPSATA